MKKNLTELVFILDRSGSVSALAQDFIGGFNSIIDKQKEADGEAYVTTVLFDHEYMLLHDHVKLEDVATMTGADFQPRGMTALYDAVGLTINSIGERLNNTPEEERPEKVIFVITTDGRENASREFSITKVKEMIEHQQSKYSWTFMFLGANIDSATVATDIGISSNFTRNYTATAAGVASHAEGIATSLCYMRSADYSCDASNASYKAVMDALDSIEQA